MLTMPWEAAQVFPDRFNFAFSDNGRWAVSLRTTDEDLALEIWTLATQEAICRPVPDITTATRETDALPLDDGRVLLFRADTRSATGRHGLELVQPRSSEEIFLQRLGEIPALLGGYLLSSASSAQLGFVVALDDPEHSVIWRLAGSPLRAEPVMRVPGLLSGGVWFDGDAGLLAINQTSKTSRCSGIVIDLVEQAWRRIWSVSDNSVDRIVLYNPRARVFVATTNASGEERIGWGFLGEQNIRFPEGLHRRGYARRALALDQRGERLLIHEVAGAVSRLFTYSLADDHLEPLTSPPGVISSPASWVGNLIRFPFSAPCQPPTLATVRLGTPPRWSMNHDQQRNSQTGLAPACRQHRGPTPQPGCAPAQLLEFQGAAGPIEAIAYGGPDWQWCEHLVVALHGGPLSSWRFEFDPFFQSFAAAGVAVVAPNYRGSTGYGDEHLRAVIGNWGGPDLDDVLWLGYRLQAQRACRQLPRPVVLGASYGGFLALLAACKKPQLWSACVALAPFLSASSLYETADVAVRNRIEQLGGLKRNEDESGPRDILQVCESLSIPLLLVHGTADERIPVTQSRMLRRRLCELGRTEGTHFDYLEVDSDHTGVVLALAAALRYRVVHFCLAHSAGQQSTDEHHEQTDVVAQSILHMEEFNSIDLRKTAHGERR
jgi:pimeloyl-ACP methyl ester carboxylesterase